MCAAERAQQPSCRRRGGSLAALLAAACALQSLGVAGAADAHLDILTVETSTPDRQVTVVADVRPAAATPIGSEAFTVTAGDLRLPTRVEPMISDQLAVGLVVDGSRHGAATLHTGVSGPANLLLQLPVAARVAAVADTSPPAVLAPLAVGAKDALSALDALRPHGERNTSQALTVALRQLPVAPGEPRLMLLFTSAADAGGEAAADLAGRLRKAHTLLAVVSTAADNTYWSQVTTATGGMLVASRASDLISAFETLLDPLRARYLLTFPTPGQLPAWVSVRVNTAAGTLSADALVAGGSTPDGRGEAGLPLPALSVAALLLLGAAAVLRARSAAGSRSADRPPAVDRRRRSTAKPSPPPVRRAPPPRRAMPAAEAARTSAARGAPEPAHPPPPAGAPPPPAAAPAHVGPAAAEAARTSAARGVPEPARPAPPPAAAPPPPAAAPAHVGPAAAEPGNEAGPAAPPAGDGAYADLDTQVAAAAAAVDSGRLDRRQAIAQIALAAPGRIDLLDRIMDAGRRTAGSQHANGPPTDTALDLVGSARRVAMGEATLAGPAGVRVEQTVPPGADRITRTLLRLTKNGRWECDCRTAGELARHVDVSTLVAGPNAGASRP